MRLDELRARRKALQDKTENTLNEMHEIAMESVRVADVAKNSSQILDEIDKSFEEMTGLDKKDIAFLFFATGLQLLRIVVLNEITKVEKAGSINKNEKNLHSLQEKILLRFNDRGSIDDAPYYASTRHIICKPGVPYDAQESLTKESLNKLFNKYDAVVFDFDIDEYINDKKLNLFKGANHRFATLGHDPIIGLLVGTVNIMTNTITCVESPLKIVGIEVPCIVTHHVIYSTTVKKDNISDYSHPVIGICASSIKTLEAAYNRMFDEPEAFVAAIIKQILHIGTDMFTPCGIQLPGANLVLSNKNVEKITMKIGWGDVVKVGMSAKLAGVINSLIGTLHLLTNKNIDGLEADLFEVKTRKIILYSNAIATGSNVLQVALNEIYGDKSQIKNLDIGGLFTLISRLSNDLDFITKVKMEYINGEFENLVMNGRKEFAYE